MRSPSRIVSVWMAVSLIAHSLLVMAASPAPAYAITLSEAQAASGWISAGEEHSLARTTDGTPVAWGDENDGRTSLPGIVGVARVAAGYEHSLMLMSDGTVVAVGSDSYGQCQVPENLAGVIAIAAGGQHSLALRDDGTVVAWGANGFGQSTVPPGLTGVVAISAGWNHSLALKSNGTVVAWGANGSGQSSVPPTLTNVVGIAAGGLHSLALRSNGTVTGWGQGSEGQITIPADLSGVVAVAAGQRHSLALKSDGTVVAWGGVTTGAPDGSVLVPSRLTDVVAISAGWRHSLALRSDGTPVGWGSNSSGQSLGPVSIDPAPSSKGVPTDVVFRIAYSAPIKAGGAYTNVRLEDSQGGPVATVKTIDGTLLTVTPSAALLTDKRYFLRVPAGSLVDDYGNSIAGGTYSYDTPDTISPKVVSVSPVDGAGGASVHTLVSVEFSESVALGPSVGAVTLISGSGHAVACRYSALGNRLQITPLDTLDPETSYTLTVPAGAVTDLSVNPLAAQSASSFTTGKTSTISATAGVGGSISPSGEVVVDHGANQTFTVTPASGYEVATVLVDGAATELTDDNYTFLNVTTNRTIHATFALKTAPPPSVPIAGDDRYLTAIAGSAYAFPTGAPAVVIATGENFADALGGAGLAGALDSPLLLTQKASLPKAVSDEVTRLKATKAYILGGTGAVSAQVESALKAKLGNSNVIRIAGPNRYDTAYEVAQETIAILGSSYTGSAFVATGANFPDALGASPVAAAKGMPVILADPTRTSVTLPSQVKRVWITGGVAAVPVSIETSLKKSLGNTNVTPLAGVNRYDTAARVAAYGASISMSWDGVGITTGTNFPDALAAGPVLGSKGAVMLLTEGASVPAPTSSALSANKAAITTVHFFGGDAAVPPSVRTTVLNLVK